MGQAKYGCRMPQYLSNPIQMLWWEQDEVVVIMVTLCGALFVGGWAWLALLVGPFSYSRFKKTYPKGFLKHLLFMVGLMKFEGYPTAFEKHFIE
jgi:type IV conjugative transfer system protein TraL